jgi:integrase
MANKTNPLTNTEVKNAKAKSKEYNLADGRGLALRIKPNGSKLWLFNYQRPFTKKRANMGLGIYPDVSLADARTKRNNARELLAKDLDPQEHRQSHALGMKQEAENTFRTIANQWLAVKSASVTKNYHTDITRSLELHLFPELATIPINKLTAPRVISVLKPIEAKGSLETVRRLCQRINEIMVFSVNTGILETNQLAGIIKAFQAPEKKNLPTLTPSQLPQLIVRISNASIKRTTRSLLEWQLHTMVRPSEAAGAKWSEIDTKKKLWTIPAERMKKKRIHIVPLTDQTIALLEALKPYSGHRDYIFPSDRDPKKPTNPQTANMAIKRMGYGGQLVAHGLRSIASTTLNEQGFDPDVIEAALAHTDSNEVRRAYNRSDYIDKRRVLMENWSKHIEMAAIGNLGIAAASNVVTGKFI